MTQYKTREYWLLAAVEQIRPIFSLKRHQILLDCQVSCGFASKGTRRRHIGQCWSKSSTTNETTKCFDCGFQVPMLKRFLAYGAPICQKDKVEMEQIGDWGLE